MSSLAAASTTTFTPVDLTQLSVALLMGGRSSEREVSLWTGRAIGEALRGKLQSDANSRLPRGVIDVEISADGQWCVEGVAYDALDALARLKSIDVFFVCLHGGEGEDGTLQGLLESTRRCFTGSGVRASAVCMDKQATRTLAASSGVRVSDGLCFSSREWRSSAQQIESRVLALSSGGWAIKPRCGGSSVATTVTRDSAAIRGAIEAVLATGDDVVVEALVEGVELSCAVLGNREDELAILPPIEIRPADGRFFDYEQKYSSGGARELCPAQGVSPAANRRVQELARRAYLCAGCEGYARIDFIVPLESGREGEPVLLEINTLPGMTARSLLPQEAAAIGVDYTELCLWILELAWRRHTERKS